MKNVKLFADITHVVLDRDGVINDTHVEWVTRIEDWHPVPGSLEAIATLCAAGISVSVATNQSAVGRGLCSVGDLESIHRHMQERVQSAGGVLDHVVYCPHHPNDECLCRKPKPGLLLAIMSKLGISSDKVLYVGDRLSDVQAARAAGCRCVLVLTGDGSKHVDLYKAQLQDVLTYKNLSAVVDAILYSRSGVSGLQQ